MCAANCGQLASTKIGWANKAKEIAVDTARLVEVESKFQFYPQCGLSPPRLGPFSFHHWQTQNVLNPWAEVSALFFRRKRPVGQPPGAVHCSSPRFGGAGFNGHVVQLNPSFPFAAFDISGQRSSVTGDVSIGGVVRRL